MYLEFQLCRSAASDRSSVGISQIKDLFPARGDARLSPPLALTVPLSPRAETFFKSRKGIHQEEHRFREKFLQTFRMESFHIV